MSSGSTNEGGGGFGQVACVLIFALLSLVKLRVADRDGSGSGVSRLSGFVSNGVYPRVLLSMTLTASSSVWNLFVP